ncbi:MAG: hypothetical protein OXG72_12255 [Acidobacteria bacterium]|nr:hypothetical protein [Acidobacteriota bacterium]
MRVLILVLLAAVLSMGQRCPTEPSAPPCAQASTPAPEFTQADLERAYDDGFGDGFEDGREACPAAPEPEPCPACDVTANDDQVTDQAVHDFVRLIHAECQFGPSVHEAGNTDREIKRRIRNLHQYGYCR